MNTRFESFVGLRYLMAKRRSSVLSIITLISICGVSLGVTALIVVLSVMGGFRADLMDKILGTKAHIVIQSPDYEALQDSLAIADKALEHPEVLGSSPFTEAEVMISSPTNLSGVVLRGVHIDRVGDVSKLIESIERGQLSYLVDAGPLMEELRQSRDEEFEELLRKIRQEREEIQKEREILEAPIIDGREEVRPLPGGDDLEGLPSDSKGMPDPFAPPGGMPDPFALPGESGMPDPFDDPVIGPDPFADDEDSTLPQVQRVDSGSGGPRIPGLIVGRELLKSLQVELGSEVNVVSPRGEMGPMGPIPRSRPFRIVGVFYSGMYEFDANFAYTEVEDANRFLNREGATGVELKIADINRAERVAVDLQVTLGPSVSVLDWKQLNRSLYYALRLEKIAMFVMLLFIILVASFSIVAMLIMIVIEKGREIAVLKSLGASDGEIMRIFILQGGVIGIVGTVIGLLLGLFICWALTIWGIPMNSEVYYISTLPVDVDPWEVVMVVAASITISLLATVYPSIQAARLNPLDGLRDD